jgi:hypothetical protein
MVSLTQQPRIEPHVQLAGCEKEAPPWRKREEWKRSGAAIIQVVMMQRREEVFGGTQLRAAPDVPAARATLWAMAKTV